MADSANVRTNLRALMQDHLSSTVTNLMFNRMPLVYFLLNKDGDKTGIEGLGRPKVNGQGGIVISGVKSAKARKQQIFGALTYQPLIQHKIPAVGDGKVISTLYDNDPTRAAWESNSPSTYFKRPVFRWCVRTDPYKVPKMEIRMTSRAAAGEQAAWTAIGSLFQAETESVTGVHVDWWNEHLWGTSGAGIPTNQDTDLWDNIYSIKAACAADNVYAGIDRTVAGNEWWQGNTVSDPRAAVFEDLINEAHYDEGLANKGLHVDLMLCGAANFKKAKAEAKAKGGQIMLSGIPNMGEFGFKNEVVKIDNTYIVYDPECPATEVAGLNLGTWTLAIHPDANFKVSEPSDQTKIEGGDRAITGTIETQMMLACEWPAGNVYWTTVS